ncbi:MAG: serine protease [Bacillota bacterium]|nr:serine protease [Bacillota bacterium]
MAMYRIKQSPAPAPEQLFPNGEYWKETRPGQERDLDFEEIAALNAAADEDEEGEELEPIRSFRSRFIRAALALTLILAFSVWIAYSLFPQYFDFGQLIRSAELAKDRSLSALRDAVVIVESNSGSGSGFNISPNGMIVTNAHVVDGGGILTISFSKEAGGQVFSTRDYKCIEGMDLALISIPGEDLPSVELASEIETNSRELIFIGSPLGYDWTISEGHLIGFTHTQEGEVLCFQGAVHPGSSGSPLFNEQAQVIAVVYAMLGDSEDQLGLAIPASYLISAMEEMQNE